MQVRVDVRQQLLERAAESRVAEPGVRYWLSVQAQLREGRGSPKFLTWGWSSQPQSNDRAVAVLRDNSTIVFDTDRAWTLEPGRYIIRKSR